MLPPVLEIYVVWHPGDASGAAAAGDFVQHFHGTLFSGLIGGAVEIYVRSAGWRSAADAPRPIPLPGAGPPNGVAQAEITAIVPVLGMALARAVEQEAGPWRGYVSAIAQARLDHPDRVCVLPLSISPKATDQTALGRILHGIQRIAERDASAPDEPEAALRCRDVAQAIAQLAGRLQLTVFISHTKRAGADEDGVIDLIARVRRIIGETRLKTFFDANDLQPGQDWDAALRENAKSSALLALRTDLYSSREWCQREVLIAKRAGLPVVMVDALDRGDQRGSFLMDHVPRVVLRRDADGWCDADILRGLNVLVDESLKRALWQRQERLATAQREHNVAWWAPHAPEPATFAQFLATLPADQRAPGATPRVLHPDPPLGPEERRVLDEIARLSGLTAVDIMTPRLLAARGG